MSPWGWYRARGWPARIGIGAPAALVALAALYVGGRSLQFAAAEKEAGLYLPSTANVVLRAKDLEGHAARLVETGAWRVVRRRVLRDPAIRPALNGALRDAGLPTLDQLEDERNRDAYSGDLLFRAAGRDVAAALRVGDSWSTVRWLAVTRLRWSDYLLAPFAPLALKSEAVGGQSAVTLHQDGADLWIATQGRLAIVSNDRSFLGQALRRSGSESSADRPLTIRAEFGTSKALLDLRRSVLESGAFPQVRTETVRAIELSADLSGPGATLQATFEGAEPARAQSAAPWDLTRLAPAGTTGTFVSSSGASELFAGLRDMARARGPKDPVGRNIKEALDALDEVGFSSQFLPTLGEGGLAVVTGAVEHGTRVYPGLAFLIPAKDSKASVEALCQLIKALGRGMSDTNFGPHPAGEATIWSFEWPHALQVNDFLRPCFAAIPGAFVFGNNLAFTEAILRGAGEEGAAALVPAKKVREYGVVPRPSLAGGTFVLPAIRESLDGPIPQVAKQIAEWSKSDADVRKELDAELRQENRKPTEGEVVEMFKLRRRNEASAKETELRASVHVLDFVKWVAFSLEPAAKGASLRLAMEFR